MICSTFGTNFFGAALALDDDLAIHQFDDRAVCRQRAADDDAASAGGDVDEAARAHRPPAKTTHVDVAGGVGLGETEEGHVQTAARIEVERVRRVEQRIRIRMSAERRGLQGKAADRAMLGRERHLAFEATFAQQRGNLCGNPDA